MTSRLGDHDEHGHAEECEKDEKAGTYASFDSHCRAVDATLTAPPEDHDKGKLHRVIDRLLTASLGGDLTIGTVRRLCRTAERPYRRRGVRAGLCDLCVLCGEMGRICFRSL